MLVSLQNVTVGYDRHPAIHHLQLQISAGDMLAVVGPNGAGKSTFLKLLIGEQLSLEGQVTLPDPDRVRVASPQATQLAELMASRNLAARPVAPNVLETTATTAATIGELAAQGGIVLHELTTIRASLEEAYMTLTSDSVEYRTDPASQAQMQQAQVRQAVPQGSARG